MYIAKPCQYEGNDLIIYINKPCLPFTCVEVSSPYHLYIRHCLGDVPDLTITFLGPTSPTKHHGVCNELTIGPVWSLPRSTRPAWICV